MQIWKGQGKGRELQGGTEAPRNCSWGLSSSAVPVDQEWGPQGAAQPDWACQEEAACQGQGCHAEAGVSMEGFLHCEMVTTPRRHGMMTGKECTVVLVRVPFSGKEFSQGVI